MRLRSPVGVLTLCAVAGAFALPAVATQMPPSKQALTQLSGPAPAALPTQSSPLQRVTIPQFAATLAARPIPALVVAGKPAPENVSAFLDRVSVSSPGEHENIRALIKQASGSSAVANALADEVFAQRTVDFPRTLTALSVLGELRNPAGQAALIKFIALPLPTTGHVIEGDIAERATLEQLQMKAIQGLAYAQTATGDKEILRNVSGNPSVVLRAEAIEAYLYNHAYSTQARQALASVVRPDDRIFLDRPHLLPTTTAGDFNAQLARFIALHPDRKAPAPAQARTEPALVSNDKLKDAAEKPAFLRVLKAPPQL